MKVAVVEEDMSLFITETLVRWETDCCDAVENDDDNTKEEEEMLEGMIVERREEERGWEETELEEGRKSNTSSNQGWKE